MKKLVLKQKSDRPHWVGDGFPVRSIFSYHDLAQHISPFLLLDYAGPTSFEPTNYRRGVGAHPHRGFETVTIVYDGEVEHWDSTGGGGVIRKDDVQWMTAAGGIIHEEKHSKEFAKTGGPFEMIQLWVNLPKKDKMNEAHYQTLENGNIPRVEKENALIRVIAGDFEGVKGNANTHTPINVWDMRFHGTSSQKLTLPENHTASLFVLSGKIKVGDEILGEAELGLFESIGTSLEFEVLVDSKVLFLGGEKINEPIYGYGPFVMASKEDIAQALKDYR